MTDPDHTIHGESFTTRDGQRIDPADVTRIDVDDVARLMGLRLTRMLLATDKHDPNHLTPADGVSSKNGFHPDVVTDEIRAIINRTKGTHDGT